MNRSYTVRVANGSCDRTAIRTIRDAVFVNEQSVPPEIEWDGLDDECVHIIVEDENRDAIGTGRLHPSGKIGRMAVIRQWRSRGIGGAILDKLVNMAIQQGHEAVFLHSQTHAAGFYVNAGFEAEGVEFEEAGIAHCLMRKTLIVG